MTLDGHVVNGQIVLDQPVKLPEGAAVQVEVLTQSNGDAAADEIPTLYERLKPVIGAARGLPPDASANIDHYLYGRPKQ